MVRERISTKNKDVLVKSKQLRSRMLSAILVLPSMPKGKIVGVTNALLMTKVWYRFDDKKISYCVVIDVNLVICLLTVFFIYYLEVFDVPVCLQYEFVGVVIELVKGCL